MAARISERTPVTIRRRVNGETQPVLAAQAQRFAGVLKHPVSRTEMLSRFGLDQRGCKITALWREGDRDDHPIKVGDLLELPGETHEILGVMAMPGCYVELYFSDH